MTSVRLPRPLAYFASLLPAAVAQELGELGMIRCLGRALRRRARGSRLSIGRVTLSGMPLFDRDSFRTVGIPVEVEAAWTFASRLGASATVFGDLNGQSSSYGGAVSLVIH